MSKAGKRVKSGSGQGGAKWEQPLLAATFDEESWKANVAFLVGDKPDDYTWIDILGAAIAAGSRRLFSVISKEQLEAEVRELGNPKGKKPKEVPQHFEVCEPCKTHLDNGEEIPLPLLARLIKFKLLSIKANDLRRRETEKKASDGKDKGKGGGKDKPKSAGKGKGGGKKTPEPPSAKEGSKLRKRGEEDDEGKYIDDEPDDGAQHYIIVYGYNNPHLIAYLSELGITVDSIIKISSQDYSRFQKPEIPDVEKDEKTLALDEAERAKKQKLKKELKQFWKDILLLLQKPPDGSNLHNVARKDYEVKNLIVPENLEDPEQKNNLGTALFEDIACMIYDLIDARRQYQTYLENLKLIHVPVPGETAQTQEEKPAVSAAPTPQQTTAPASLPSIHPDQMEVKAEVDMRYYNDLMNCIPQESASIPLMMHCMLEQVVATDEGSDPPSEQLPPKRADGLNSNLVSHISSMAFKLALSEEEHNMLSDIFDLPERPPDTPNQPLLMNIHDDICIRTNHLKTIYGFNPQEVEKEMLKKLPFQTLINLPRPTSAEAKERAARLQELIHFCATDGLSQSEIDRAFKQFVFECMDIASTDPNGFIITRDSEGLHHSAIPWDDPYPFFKGMIPKHEKPSSEELMLTPSEERSGSDMELIDYEVSDTPSSGPDTREVTPNVTPEPPSSPNSDQTPRKSRSKKKSSKSAASPTPIPPRELKEMEKSPSGSDRSRPSTADSKKGILRPRSRSSSAGKRSRSNSVHFETDEAGHPIRHVELEDKEVTEEEPVKSAEESMHEIVDAQKRVLDQWCFAEHYEPHILLQVLKEASYTLPFIDHYFNKRDNSMMVILHNPYNTEFQNHVDWHTELHCNLGFRNYLEYVAESISDWVQEEEAKYSAHLLSRELDKMRQDEDAAAKAAEKAATKGKKSPRKSPSRSKSPKSRGSSQERSSSANSNMFIRANSLKAYKEEQDRLKAEEEEKERAQSAKRARSAQKRAEKEAEKEKKRPGSRGSAKSKSSKEREAEPQEAPPEQESPPERYWPFTGYDVGNKLIHVSGITTSMFPSDGGQIRTERTEFVQGTTSIKSTVLKDGHNFTVHILDPKESTEESDQEEDLLPPTEEKADFEKSEKDDAKTVEGERGSSAQKTGKMDGEKSSVSAFGSITAQLMDGMTLSLSQYGASGESKDGKKYEPLPYTPPPSTPVPGPPPSPTKSKKGDKKGAPTPEPPPPTTPLEDEEKKDQEEKKDEEKPIQQPFQQLYVSCPDGLNVKYLLESSLGMKPIAEDDRRLLVKQSYPYKTKGEQECEAIRKKYALKETSRIMTSEGTVIKIMEDGNIEVLYADGTLSVHTGHWELPKGRGTSPQRSESVKEERGTWTTTYPTGEKIMYKGNGDMEELKAVMISVASDPETNQTMATRDDHVITVSYPDGTTIVEHADGTRITTYYRENTMNQEEGQDIEMEKEFDTQTVKFVKVECPAYATVEFNCATSENLTIFGNGSTINVFPDGYYMLHHWDGGRCEVDTEGTVTYYPRPDKITEQLLPERELQYVLRHNADVVVETVDMEGNVFNVKSNGDFQVIPVNGDEMSDVSNEDLLKPEKKLTTFKEHAPRFLIIHSDGSGTELMRYQDIAEYLTMAEQSPATAVLKDELANFPGVTGITILKPYIGGPSDRWLKKYDQESIIPHGIRCRDLTTLPPKEFKMPGGRFGTNLGQGLAVGGAVKQQVRIPILKCPSTLELRQMIQYKPVSPALREKLQNGLREYAEYVIERNKVADYMKVVDPRTEEEKINASDLQEIGLQQAKDKNYASANVKELYEKATAPPVPSPPPTPQPKRTQADWDRDQREIAEELTGREALRKKKIPSYFDSEFGKAFLLTQAKDVDEILRELSEDPRKDGTEAVRGQLSGQSGQQMSPVTSAYPTSAYPARSLAAVTSVQSDRSSTSPGDTLPPKNVPDTPLSYADNELRGVYTETVPSRGGIRPGNPTPAHAEGQGSPAPIRPQNPTPVHAGKEKTGRPINPTPKHAGGGMDSPSDLPSQLDYPAIIMEQPLEELEEGEDEVDNEQLTLTRSLKVNVLGQPRKNRVPLPAGIKGGRPGAIPNIKYISVEEPVRRKVNTSLVAGASIKGQNQLSHMSGLILFPEEVEFGVLKEGCTYCYTVYLKNTGVDSCRFRIKQPPPATGLRIVYKPGPIAAGMSVELNVELYAIAVGVEGEMGVGSVRHDLEIVTQTDVLFLPISATVLTAYEYDHRSPNSPKGGKSKGAKLISTKPPATTGIIRPRKTPLGVGNAPNVSSYIR
ncbi:sperm-associated antigen 17-like isoform X2 [Saccostrea echinata]|uniref:sperm-associated antigen 17-like isoform X2 n=1 Tax=Saccostrea echinata TaxID=191078 RepID=UPI002A7F18B8|nr:sperm-associated antigen 17-like isoform X2 [Saccostrea echinata]